MKPKASQPPSAGFALEEFLPYRLSVVTNRASRLFARRYSEEFGLAIPEWRVLAVVGRFGGLSATAVVERTAMDKVKVSRAVRALLDRGLLRREEDPGDRRVQRLAIPPRAAASMPGSCPWRAGWKRNCWPASAPPNGPRCAGLLDALDRRLSEMGAEPGAGGPD